MSFSKPMPDSTLEEETVMKWLEDNGGQFTPIRQNGQNIRRRTAWVKKDYWETQWGRDMRNLDIEDPDSALGKRFRLRFRVPFAMYKEILLPMCRERGIFPSNGSWREKIPSEFKLLMCLRILGRGNYADDVSELSGIAPSSVNSIFKHFVTRFASTFQEDYIKFHTGDRKAQMDLLYAMMGAPGNIGSMDASSWGVSSINVRAKRATPPWLGCASRIF